uniref:(northern house mosquito) hypothetical protein n=1 Tax=Culex pipiens TaxID=7175 RepID=A0A8D8AYJ9_CULPI
MESNRFGLQKLNNDNYSSWKFKVELLLVREDMWGCVDPGTKPNAVDEASWKALDAKCRATIGLLLEDNQLGLIRGAATSKDTWAALKDHHHKATLTSKCRC